MKTLILTSTLHLSVKISKHPLFHKHLSQISKSNRRVPRTRLIINNKLRNNNKEVAPNKLIIDEQFKNNIQECFSKKQSKMNLENQLADICKRKHQAFISRNAINASDSLLIKKPEIILALSQSQQRQLITQIKMIARILTQNTRR